jgi:hypothetical protein
MIDFVSTLLRGMINGAEAIQSIGTNEAARKPLTTLNKTK